MGLPRDPGLRNASVVLRPWSEADVPAIVEACQDPAVSEFSPVIPFPFERDHAIEWLGGHEAARRAGTALELAVADPATGGVLGAIALSEIDAGQNTASIGYWLARPARGHGHASEAVRLLAAWAFDALGLARVELLTDPANAASRAVAERCGFVREGLLRSHLVVFHSGRRRDSVVYGLLPGELR